MRIDGKLIAENIYKKIKTEIVDITKPKLHIVACAPNSVTQQYLDLKKQKAGDLGIEVTTSVLEETATTDDVVRVIQEKTADDTPLVVQLPLPLHIDTDAVLQALPVVNDVDGLRFVEVDEHPYLSPVAGAIAEIISYKSLSITQKKVVVVGEGRLVGAPVIKWFRQNGAVIETLNKNTFSPEIIKTADIIVSGVGVPSIITKEMVKEGVVLFDAGTSGASGTVRGDIDPACYSLASLYTPVPGGIGPITIALLLSNVLQANLLNNPAG